jgi:hypothetical protein
LIQLLDMAIQVGIPGDDINSVRDPFLQGVISLPVEFDGVPMKKDLMHSLDHPRRQKRFFYRLPCPDQPAGSVPSACKRRAARVAYGELSEKTALTTLFFIWR